MMSKKNEILCILRVTTEIVLHTSPGVTVTEAVVTSEDLCTARYVCCMSTSALTVWGVVKFKMASKPTLYVCFQ